MEKRSPTTPSLSLLRQQLLAALPGDADLNAFCLDHFSMVHRRFSLGMDRLAKVNLLFEQVSSEEIYRILNPLISSATCRLIVDDSRSKAIQTPAIPPTEEAPHSSHFVIQRGWVIPLIIVTILMSLSLAFAQQSWLHWPHSSAVRSVPQSIDCSVFSDGPTGPSQEKQNPTLSQCNPAATLPLTGVHSNNLSVQNSKSSHRLTYTVKKRRGYVPPPIED